MADKADTHSLEYEVTGANSYTDATQQIDDGKNGRRPARMVQLTLSPQPDTAQGVMSAMQANGSQIAGQPHSQNIGSGALIMVFKEADRPFPFETGDRVILSKK